MSSGYTAKRKNVIEVGVVLEGVERKAIQSQNNILCGKRKRTTEIASVQEPGPKSKADNTEE